MLTYHKIKDKPNILKNLTGLCPVTFAEFVSSFKVTYFEHLEEQEIKRTKPRQRGQGAGRKGKLRTIEDKLLFILFYFKCYPTQKILGGLFGLSQAQTHQWIHHLTPILNKALGYKKKLPPQKLKKINMLLIECPGLEFIINLGLERNNGN